MDKATVADAASDLYNHLTKTGYPCWLMSVGVDEVNNKVYIMTKRKSFFGKNKLPKEWMGFPIVIEYTGQIRPCQS